MMANMVKSPGDAVAFLYIIELSRNCNCKRVYTVELHSASTVRVPYDCMTYRMTYRTEYRYLYLVYSETLITEYRVYLYGTSNRT